MLSLPYVYKMSGLILGTILLILGGLTVIWSLGMLVQTTRTLKAPKNYMEICKQIGGKPLAGALEAAILVYTIGILLIYQVISVELINTFLIQLGADKSIVKNYWVIAGQKIGTAIFLLYPLCIMRDMSSLSYASLISIITMSYTIIVVIIEAPFYFKQNYHQYGIDYFIIDINIFDAFSFTFFSYCFQHIFFNIYHELQKPSNRRINKVSTILYKI